MKVPPKRKGNHHGTGRVGGKLSPSMKVPPKRKGNDEALRRAGAEAALNESPSEKEGKSCCGACGWTETGPQ